MREVIINIRCDYCKEQFTEPIEGSNAVIFTVGARKWEMDLCFECLGGPFFTNARESESVKKQGKEHACHCGKTFTSKRGMTQHKTRTHE